MPLRCAKGKIRYRWVTRGGKKVRLAFCGSKVIEIKKKGGRAKKV